MNDGMWQMSRPDLEARVAELEAEANREERAMEQVIDERDAAEEALSQTYFLVTGNSPEWSNLFGYAEALEEIDDAQYTLRQTIRRLEAENKRLQECADAKWRCFHCDFFTSDPDEAEAHFGSTDDAEEFCPICKWWAKMDDNEKREQFQSAIKELNQERMDKWGFVIISGGDEYSAQVVPDVASMEQAVHDLLCCCKSKAEECETFIRDYLSDLRDDDEWTRNYPDYKKDAFHLNLEDGFIQINRLTPDFPREEAKPTVIQPKSGPYDAKDVIDVKEAATAQERG